MAAVPDPAVETVLADAQRICAVPAPTFAEGPRGELVGELFAQAGLTPEQDAVGNVLCSVAGEGPPAVFAAHLDTVFGPEQPIEIVRADGRIAAPGIGDNSLAVAALVALARRLAASPARRPVVLAATVGEEGLGDLRGAKHLVETIDCRCFVAMEGMSLDAIEVGGIGSQRFRATYVGPGGHSWSDRGTPSAVHGLMTRAAELVAIALEPDVSLNVGRVHGGTSINTIAGRATLELDVRARDPARLSALAARADALLRRAPEGLEAMVECVGRRPAGAIAPDDPLLGAARRARSAAGLEPAEESFSSTDANAAYGRGIPAITVGISTGAHAHRPDEYIDEAPTAAGLRALELLLDELAYA
jgi:tripeptide aminopeptidase